jgi:hypothetical protein
MREIQRGWRRSDEGRKIFLKLGCKDRGGYFRVSVRRNRRVAGSEVSKGINEDTGSRVANFSSALLFGCLMTLN